VTSRHDGRRRFVLANGRLPGSDQIVNVEVIDGTIHRIGSIDESTAAVETIDLGQRWLIPGLWDNHVHFSQWAATARRLDMSTAMSAAKAAVLVSQHCADIPAGEALIGFGFRDGLWPDAPRRELLDTAAGPVPVVLVSGDLHSCWMNSMALARYGYADHPTGLLVEDDSFAVVRALDTVDDLVMDGWVDDAAQMAASRGVVGIVDLEMTWSLDRWVRRMAAGTDALRVEFGIYTEHLDRAVGLGLRSGAVIDGTHGLLTVGPYKVVSDGSLNTRTAYCFDEYPGLEGQDVSRGLPAVSKEQLLSRMAMAAQAGIRPAVHAIGDHANGIALDVFEELGCTGSIEHAQLLATADIARFARLGVVASVQPEHAMDDRDVADHYWEGRTERAFMLASLLNAGVVLALGSDAPVAPLDPWVSMAAAVSRTRDGREPWHAEQAISRQSALAASTRGRHAIAVGDVADLAICGIDPFAASVAELRQMPVAATMLGGRFTHNAL
jgi:predicted amidohydrolase YtcJ